MHWIFTFMLTALFPLYTFTQYSISGQVFSPSGQAIEFATVSIYPLSDSTDIRAVITNEKTGVFKIDNLKKNDYQLVIQMLGYKDWEKKVNLSKNIMLGEIILQAEVALLETVEVVAEQSILESRLGKKVLRIGQDLSNAGSNAFEALDGIPSITTTERGEVQIRGNSNVIIYINGRETRRDPATLKYISAEVLEKIEVITNPSAKYDAEGVGGIINLVYRKGKTSKLKLENIVNGSNTGIDGGLNASLSKDKFSFFTNVSLGFDQYKSTSKATRTNFNDSLQVFENQHLYTTNAWVGNFNMGVSLEPDSTLSMTLELNYDYWDFKGDSEQSSQFIFKNEETKSIELTNRQKELENELWLNYSFEKEWKSERILELSLTTGGEDENNFTQSPSDLNLTDFPTALQQFLLKSDERESQRYYQGKLNFKAPFFKFGSMETGLKADFIQYNILQKVQLRSSTIPLPDNDFSMDMQKLGIYFLQTHQLKKLEYSLGARMEQFSSKAIQRASQNTFTQKYLRLFPSIQLHYLMPDKSHHIGLNYTRRINRPGFFSLNPFVSYEDPLNLRTGNPGLRPEIADLYELNYHKSMDKWEVDVTFYRRETADAILSTVASIDNDQSLSKPVNFAQQSNQGLEAQLEYRPHSSIKAMATFVWGQVKFLDNENLIQFHKNNIWNVRFQQQFKLANNWKIDLVETYRAPRFGAQTKTQEVFYMNLGIGKKFKNKKGSFSLSVRDIFNTRQRVMLLQTPDFELKRSYKWQTRQITLGLRYLIFNN